MCKIGKLTPHVIESMFGTLKKRVVGCACASGCLAESYVGLPITTDQGSARPAAAPADSALPFLLFQTHARAT